MGGVRGGVRGSHDRGGVRRSTQEHQRLLEMCIQFYDLLDVLDLVHELHFCHPPDVLERADLEMRRGSNRSPRAPPNPLSYRVDSGNDWPVGPRMQVDKTARGASSIYLSFGAAKELTALTPPMGESGGESGGVTTEGSQKEHPGASTSS